MKILFLCMLSVAGLSTFIVNNKSAEASDGFTNIVTKGYIPDENTAVKIAEAIWIPVYGKDNIMKQKPFKVVLKDSAVWVVTGTMKEIQLGGTAYIEIQKSDCRILKVTHGK